MGDSGHFHPPWSQRLDIGTTTLAARLYNTHGEPLAIASALNPQSSLGADVISRIKSSIEGNAERLKELIVSSIDKLIDELCVRARVGRGSVLQERWDTLEGRRNDPFLRTSRSN